MKNNKLEFLRGGAATLVVICHLIYTNSILNKIPSLNIIGGWGTESVIIFFILSGIVINMTQTKKPKSINEFLTNRFLRIYPLYLVSLMLAYIIYFTLTNNINFKEVIGNLFFLGTLQSYLVDVPKYNPVVWSLSFEIFFYVLFSFTIGRYQKLLIKIWLAISLLCIPLYYFEFSGVAGYFITMLGFSTIWIIGYYLYEFRNKFNKPGIPLVIVFVSMLPGISRLNFSSLYYDVGKYVIFALATIPLFIYCLNNDFNRIDKTKYSFKIAHVLVLMVILWVLLSFSSSLKFNKFIYAGLPVGGLLLYFILPGLRLDRFNYLKKHISIIGRISYALYIVHYPILILTNYAFGRNLAFYTFVSIFLILMTSLILEYKFQPLVTKFIKSKSKSLANH